MKHLFRRPLLPLAVLAALLFGVCVMTAFQMGIENDMARIDDLYQSTQVSFCVLPGAASDGNLRFRVTTAETIAAQDEVSSAYVHLSCPYSLREPKQAAALSWIYGTNRADRFFVEKGVSVLYAEGYSAADLEQIAGSGIPCVADAALAELLGLTFGDTLVIAPNEGNAEDREKAPALTLRLLGAYTDPAAVLAPYGLVTSDQIFLTKGGLLYNSNMMQSYCFYQGFAFDLDPEYNREFERIEAETKERIGGDVILYSNIRMLRQAVRPLEQKLEIERMLTTPLSAAFCIAAAALSVLLALDLNREIFLRRLWGEGRVAVCGRLLGTVAALIAVGFAVSLLGALLLGGRAYLSFAARYLSVAAALCLFAAGAPIAWASGRNLVEFYQSQED